MSRGRSKAHEYNARGECIYCGMYRCNIEAFGHVCTYERECLFETHRIVHFRIRRTGDTMLAIAPGNSPEFTATPVPDTPPLKPPTWTSSDATNAPVSADATGLIATVAIPSTATVGASFTLTVSYTNPDGTVATGSITETIVAPAAPDITSFTIAQTT